MEWFKSESIFKSHKDLLSCLQNGFRYMEDESSIKEKECFLDLGLFPADQRICDPTWIDICGELYELDENRKKGMNIIHKLTIKIFVNHMIHQIFILSFRGIHKWGKKKYWLYFVKVRVFLASLMHLKKVLNWLHGNLHQVVETWDKVFNEFQRRLDWSKNTRIWSLARKILRQTFFISQSNLVLSNPLS